MVDIGWVSKTSHLYVVHFAQQWTACGFRGTTTGIAGAALVLVYGNEAGTLTFLVSILTYLPL